MWAKLGLVALLGAALSCPPALAQGLTPFSHLFVIVLENHGLKGVIGNPNLPALNGLARQYGLATDYSGVAHPSLPNYVALMFGSTFGSRSDNPAQRFAGDNLALQLERAGKSWKGYVQGLPKPGWDGPYAGPYGKKHNPFMLSAEIAKNPGRAANVVPLGQLFADLKAGHAPDFALIVPDVCHDLHGGAGCPRGAALERAGDDFVRDTVGAILASPAWSGNAAVVVTFDEAGGGDVRGGGGVVPAVVVTRQGPRGVQSDQPYNHYSLLRTFEDAWGLPPLREAGRATPMLDLFAKP